ncbi:MAG: hypothetical protein LBQ60_10225 [Bacteroidales bacterium]|jgi:hypothetical protein|nr:hypothetical protein [Bacteroidales bacterium]
MKIITLYRQETTSYICIICFYAVCFLFSACNFSIKPEYDFTLDTYGIKFHIPPGYRQIAIENEINADRMWDNIKKVKGKLSYNDSLLSGMIIKQHLLKGNPGILFCDTTDYSNSIFFFIAPHLRINQDTAEQLTQVMQKLVWIPGVNQVFWEERKVIEGGTYRFIKVKLKIKKDNDKTVYRTSYILPLKSKSLGIMVTNDSGEDQETNVKQISIRHI